MFIVRVLSLALFVISWSLSTDAGSAMDPNGGGGAMDPNGARSCYTACIDPNG